MAILGLDEIPALGVVTTPSSHTLGSPASTGWFTLATSYASTIRARSTRAIHLCANSVSPRKAWARANAAMDTALLSSTATERVSRSPRPQEDPAE
jgi:hypothetical protein